MKTSNSPEGRFARLVQEFFLDRMRSKQLYPKPQRAAGGRPLVLAVCRAEGP